MRKSRTPFLDRDLIGFAQSIPASLKMRVVDEPTSKTVEQWILRQACKDLLPGDLVWREKAQFDEGTGTVDTLDEALSMAASTPAPLNRAEEARLYEDILRQQFEDPEMILQNSGTWAQDRVAVED